MWRRPAAAETQVSLRAAPPRLFLGRRCGVYRQLRHHHNPGAAADESGISSRGRGAHDARSSTLLLSGAALVSVPLITRGHRISPTSKAARYLTASRRLLAASQLQEESSGRGDSSINDYEQERGPPLQAWGPPACTGSSAWCATSDDSSSNSSSRSSSNSSSRSSSSSGSSSRSNISSSGGSSSSSSSSSGGGSFGRAPRVHDLRIFEELMRPYHGGVRTPENFRGSKSGVASEAAAVDAAAGEGGRLILLVLNQPLPYYFNSLLSRASLVVAADGAANHLLHIYRAAEDRQLRQHQLQQQQQQQQQQQDEGAFRMQDENAITAVKDKLCNSKVNVLGESSDHEGGEGGHTPQLPACICGDFDSSLAEVIISFVFLFFI
ncbi:hypothetical protein Emag_003143 [Eimeria magna]